MADVFETQRPAVRGVTHMVATGHYLASAAGYRILEDGGNATDAGIAAGMVLWALRCPSGSALVVWRRS